MFFVIQKISKIVEKLIPTKLFKSNCFLRLNCCIKGTFKEGMIKSIVVVVGMMTKITRMMMLMMMTMMMMMMMMLIVMVLTEPTRE